MFSVSISHSSFRPHCRRLGIGTLIGLAVWMCASVSLAAEDQATQFLAKLRERGWPDVALEYLERAAEDPLASAEFLQTVDYEIAVTRSALARQAIGEKERDSLLAAAAQEFHTFVANNPDSPQAVAALAQLGSLQGDQAISTLNQADRVAPGAGPEAQQLRDSARELIDRAVKSLEQLLAVIPDRLAGLPKGTSGLGNKEALALRQDLENKQAESGFMLANLNYERARTFAPKSPEWQEALETAAQGFDALGRQYENKLVGFYSQLYMGRCFQTLEDYSKALDVYEGLISQPVGQADFRKLVARAYRHRAECYLALDLPSKVIDECSRWLDQSSAEERSQGEWLGVMLQLANAYRTKAEHDTTDTSASRLRTEARKLYREVSRSGGEFQEEARWALALSEGGKPKQIEVKGFSEAFAAGKDAVEVMTSSQLAGRLAANNNPDAVVDLERQVEENRASAIQYFEKAITLIEQDTPQEEAAGAYYSLCWLYWNAGRSTEAAELGYQVAEKYPESPFAPTGANVTLAAYERLYLEAQAAGQANAITEATAKLREVAELIVERWGESESATTATKMLISLALQEDRFDEAEQLFTDLPVEKRGTTGLSLGGRMWTRYLKLSSGKPGGSYPETDRLKSRAGELLAEGFAALAKSTTASPAENVGALYYAQFLLAESEADWAVKVLETSPTGPLAQLKAMKENRAFATEVCKAALRAYVSVDPPRSKEAISMMDQLEQLTGSTPKAQQELTGIYVSLGRQLQQQIKALTARGKTKQARGAAEAFTKLLDRVAEQGDSQSWAIRAWLAETSLNLGSELPGDEGERYLKRAEDAFRDLLATAEKDPKFAPNELSILTVRKKLGECAQERGNFEEAVEQYSAILAKKPNIFELQHAAATALGEWGIQEKDPTRLDQAIRGAQPQANGQNLIWGWLQVADQALSQSARAAKQDPPQEAFVEKYSDLFFEARLRAAEARLAAAQLASGESRTLQLKTVRQTIATLKQLYPDLGGPRWESEFARVAKEAEQ